MIPGRRTGLVRLGSPDPKSVDSFHAAWRKWCRIVEPTAVHAGPEQRSGVRDRLAESGYEPLPDLDTLEQMVCGVCRGVPLLMAALGWEEPHAGGKADRRGPTDAARGAQWRLVMAYGGFETAVKSVRLDLSRYGLSAKVLERIADDARLGEFPMIEPPRLAKAVSDQWLQFDDEGRSPVGEFLGLADADTHTVADWLVKRSPIDSWAKSVRLARALRHATAHGALSASKVREWKLIPAMGRLIGDLAAVAAVVLEGCCPDGRS